MTQLQVMEHLVKTAGVSKKDAKLVLHQLNVLVVRELKKRLDPAGRTGDFPQAQPRGPDRRQSRHRRTNQNSSPYTIALHPGQGAERVRLRRDCTSGEEAASRQGKARRSQDCQQEISN